MTTELKRNAKLEVKLVTNHEQLLHAYAVRAICFMDEHGVTARQVYDGNDYQATHVIVYENDEPVGTVRVRWFREFAKFERASFLPQHRNPWVIKTCANFVFEHCARKGFDTVITHATPRPALLWRRLLGFEVADKPKFTFIGHEGDYVELIKRLEPASNAINLKTDIATLFRIEGEWDEQSSFEANQ
ncbi:MAG: hypothetical protein AB7O39_09710 [Flavobacteriaceae bacterium]